MRKAMWGGKASGRRPLGVALTAGSIVIPAVIGVGLITDRPSPVARDIDVRFLHGTFEPETIVRRPVSTPAQP